ncbi:MAG: di-heme oxidoredictase family protein [Vicinamibacterales bacterium]
MRVRISSALTAAAIAWMAATVATQGRAPIGRELAVPRHLADGEEYTVPMHVLLDYGRLLLDARWTTQEGAGRPLTKGTGAPLTDPMNPLVFPRAFNRVSGPDSNACSGCHNSPFGLVGGGGDIVANVFVLGQRFDFASFDGNDAMATHGTADERGLATTLQSIANSRITVGMFGSGYIEMLARQMTGELQASRDATSPGTSRRLVASGVDFGRIARRPDGSWDTSGVEGLPAPSLQTSGAAQPPSLLVRPFHQAGAVVSLRQFTNNAFNHHHGIQSTERFGVDTDPDGDGVANELTRADVTAATLFQATMAVPGRMVPNDRAVEAAVLLGEQRFADVGCATCHRPSLALRRRGWVFTEPGPYNPPGNANPSSVTPLAVDLTDRRLPSPRLDVRGGVVEVPAFTDLKLHDITDDGDGNEEPLDMNEALGSPGFFAGNRRFLTRKLWGTGADGAYFHHGQFTTLREAIEAHGGEARAARAAYRALPADEQDAVVEFLKSLRVLPPGTRALVVDEYGRPRAWPPRRHTND